MKTTYKINLVSVFFGTIILIIILNGLNNGAVHPLEMVAIIFFVGCTFFTASLAQIAAVREHSLKQCVTEQVLEQTFAEKPLNVSGCILLPMFPAFLRWMFKDSQYTCTSIQISRQGTVFQVVHAA